MIDTHQKTKENVLFLHTDKFKTDTIGIMLRTVLNDEDATKTSLLSQVLKKGCKKYPSSQSIEIATEELYGSVFDISILKKGDYQIIFFYLEVIHLPQEELFEKAVQFLEETLYHPLVKNGAFLPEIVEREKAVLADKIKGRIDDKKEYAKQRCLEEMFQGQPFGVYADGKIEDLDTIDSKNLYDHYLKLIKEAAIEVVVVGDLLGNHKKEICMEKLAGQTVLKDMDRKADGDGEKLQKRQPKEVLETLDINQGKLCMGYQTGLTPYGRDYYGLLLFNEILGGNANSRLFNTIREKESLCYYVNSYLYRFKMILLIQAGIEKSQYQKTAELIEKEIKTIQKEGIDKKELESAKISLINNYSGIEDSSTAMMDYSYTQKLLKSDETLKELLRQIQEASLDDVMRAAKQVFLDTKYFLAGAK